MIDADHLKKWILQRWEKAYLNEDLPTREVLEQIDREISYKMIDIDPQLKWIPVAERLPEIPKGFEEYIVMIKGATLPTALFWDGKRWYDINEEKTLYPVIAWMPLPDPYMEEE